MSQHRFTTKLGNTEVVVTMGWDQPLQGYFMTIMETNSATSMAENEDTEEKEVYLFDNFKQFDSHPKEITGYLFELELLGIDVPRQMIDEVMMEGVRNIGNKIVEHSYVDGKHVRKQTL